MHHQRRGGPVRITGETDSKIDPIAVAKALGAFRIIYVGKSKDIFGECAKAKRILESVMEGYDDYDGIQSDDPLTDD